MIPGMLEAATGDLQNVEGSLPGWRVLWVMNGVLLAAGGCRGVGGGSRRGGASASIRRP
jgi:hypothetical protein